MCILVGFLSAVGRIGYVGIFVGTDNEPDAAIIVEVVPNPIDEGDNFVAKPY